MSFEPIALPWLLRAPEGFRNSCRALSDADPELGATLQKMATHYLDAAQAAAFGKAMARLRAGGAKFEPLSGFRLAILPGATFDFIAAATPAAAARHGIAVEVTLCPLDQIEQQAYDVASELYRATPDAVLLAVDHRWLGLDKPALDGDHELRLQDAVDRLRGVLGALSETAATTAIVPTIPVPPSQLFGSYDRREPGSVRSLIDRFNALLPGICAETGSVLFDVAALAESVGTATWFDAAFYSLYKLPFSPDAVPLYCDGLARLMGAMRGKARKCLVLDLDNTCWGGVIGDDGLENIRVGGGGAGGDSFLSVQRMALELKARGVILAVSSKNEDETARLPFREHPDMLLKESDIAVFQANWNDKASNLEAIAAKLEIGLDALVLLDDNGAERAQVRSALPMVGVPELPNDPALYPAILLGAGYFEAVSFSSEDRARSASYAANAQRAEVYSKARNLDDYLASLEMQIGFAPFDALNRPRIAQLINKTNQFNLTTRRYTEAQVAQMEAGSAAFTLQTRLADRYGDFGMIGVIIANETEMGQVWEIDTWLMSCRVLGRKVDEAMLAELVEAARAAGVTRLLARYIPTAKNRMVADHFDKLGFIRVAEHDDGGREYELAPSSFVEPKLPFARAAEKAPA
ncbi:HAD-IIIC family phosphatase [Phenylobacterium koreense]|uniref:FkbH-like protein n=1 Tax=Phenylobacterium koreense TaxID=266125 RepID=A0ABV2EM66_9CAUL